MTPDRLEELLRRADADAGPPPPLPHDLVARVRRRAARRHGRNMLASSAAAAILLAIGLSMPLQHQLGRAVPAGTGEYAAVPRPTIDVASVQMELTRLRAQAESRLVVARRMVALEAERAVSETTEPQPEYPDPVRQASLEAERAAFILVQHADRMQRELHEPASAAEGYRETIRLFPKTPWAAVARELLTTIAHETGGAL